MLETDFFSSILLPGTLGFIMFGVGLSLTRKDFRNIFVQPRGVITGLCGQMLLLPFVAFLIAESWPGLRPEFKVGMVLIAACPGGATSNLITHLLKGNVALSVSMTTANSFLTLFTIPTIMNVALAYFSADEANQVDVEMPVLDTIQQILFITLLPTLAGIAIRAQNAKLALRLERPLKVVMPVMLAGAVAAALLLESKDGESPPVDAYFAALPATLTLNFCGLATGYLLAWAMRLGTASSLTISVEVGLQNSALAITIATSPLILDDAFIAAPAAAYSAFSFFTATLFGLMVKRISRMRKMSLSLNKKEGKQE